MNPATLDAEPGWATFEPRSVKRLAEQVQIAIESTKLYSLSDRLVLLLKFVDVRSQLGFARHTAEVEAYHFIGPKRWLSSRPNHHVKPIVLDRSFQHGPFIKVATTVACNVDPRRYIAIDFEISMQSPLNHATAGL